MMDAEVPEGECQTTKGPGYSVALSVQVSYCGGIVAEDLNRAFLQTGAERHQSPVDSQEVKVVDVLVQHVGGPWPSDTSPERSIHGQGHRGGQR